MQRPHVQGLSALLAKRMARAPVISPLLANRVAQRVLCRLTLYWRGWRNAPGVLPTSIVHRNIEDVKHVDFLQPA